MKPVASLTRKQLVDLVTSVFEYFINGGDDIGYVEAVLDHYDLLPGDDVALPPPEPQSGSWKQRIGVAYGDGLRDARNGHTKATGLAFQAAYDQGYLHGTK
jgi:hypothetical protein